MEIAELVRMSGHDAATVVEPHRGGSRDDELALLPAGDSS
jgi:hypothetical protein